jgi:hypothetical protein
MSESYILSLLFPKPDEDQNTTLINHDNSGREESYSKHRVNPCLELREYLCMLCVLDPLLLLRSSAPVIRTASRPYRKPVKGHRTDNRILPRTLLEQHGFCP